MDLFPSIKQTVMRRWLRNHYNVNGKNLWFAVGKNGGTNPIFGLKKEIGDLRVSVLSGLTLGSFYQTDTLVLTAKRRAKNFLTQS